MQYAALRNSLLTARDRRQTLLEQAFAVGYPTTVALALNIPGQDKSPPGGAVLFEWGQDRLLRALPRLAPLHREEDALGPWALFGSRLGPSAAKELCIAIEASRPTARLLDIDVYAAPGRPVDRDRLQRPQRTCLICDRPARECIRARCHSEAELIARTHELLRPFTP